MASGGQKQVLESITKKGILDRLQSHDPAKDNRPTDCFFFQLSYPYNKKWIEVKQELEDKIAEITDNFLRSEKNKKFGEWFRFEDCWSLTYFLDAQGNCSQRDKDQHWSKFEEDLNFNVRLKLRKLLKEKDKNLPDMHIVIMRACKYALSYSERMDTD